MNHLPKKVAVNPKYELDKKTYLKINKMLKKSEIMKNDKEMIRYFKEKYQTTNTSNFNDKIKFIIESGILFIKNKNILKNNPKLIKIYEVFERKLGDIIKISIENRDMDDYRIANFIIIYLDDILYQE